jgi:hypothetical protein
MKTWAATMLILVGLTTSGRAATLEFSALLQVGNENRFVVTDLDSGQSSGWTVVGRAFRDHALTYFDVEAEILSLRTSGDIIDLRLRPAFSGGRADPEELRTKILRNLLVLADAAEKYFREQKATSVVGRELAEHANLRLPTTVDGEDYPTLVLRQGVTMTLKTRSGIEIEYPTDLDEVREAAK